MVKGSGPISSQDALAPPDVRAALPNKDGSYRVVDVDGGSLLECVSRVVGLLFESMEARGLSPPEVALREIVENFVHAVPCAVSVVLDPSFSNIYISDTGPGIRDVELALKPGYSTATSLQRTYIRGVGLGLHFARDELRSMGGDLYVDSVFGGGTYIRMALRNTSLSGDDSQGANGICLTQRQNNILFLLSEGESLGPSRVAAELSIGISTAHRELVKLQESGLILFMPNGKRFLSDVGRSYLQGLLSL